MHSDKLMMNFIYKLSVFIQERNPSIVDIQCVFSFEADPENSCCETTLVRVINER